MKKHLNEVFLIGLLFMRINLSLCKYYLPFLLLFSFLNPFIMTGFNLILKRIKPDFIQFEISTLFPYPSIYVLFVPDNPILTKMFKGLKFPKDLKSFKNSYSISPLVDGWKKMEVYTQTYLAIYVEEMTLLENVNITSLTVENMTATNYHIKNLTYVSYVIGKYGFELSISRDLKSAYMTLMYVIKCALYSMYTNEAMPKSYVVGLPNSIYFEIQWPCIQLMFYYLIFGCIILHIKTVRRLSKGSLMPQKGWYTIINYIIITFIYQSICFVIFIFTSLALGTKSFNSHIVHTVSWYYLLFTFLINSNTILLFGMMLCEFDMTTYNALYFLGMIMAPQLLYIFAFGQNNASNCYFQYLTCLSPLFAVSWSLTTLESIQAENRFFITDLTLQDEFKSKCFSFRIALGFQFMHNIINILFIFYRNFIGDLIKRQNIVIKKEKTKKYRKGLPLKYRRKKKVVKESPPVSEDSLVHNDISFPSTDYIITTQKLIKIFMVNGAVRKVLKGISINFRRNKITTILGPNGSGKTALLKVLSGIYTPNSGTIVINGTSIETNRFEAFSNISKYIDEVRIFNILTVKEYFQLIIHKSKNEYHKMLNDNLKTFIDICRLKNYMLISIQCCPRSIIRVIKIISAFLSEKPVILLDDPMEGLDYILMQSVCALFVYMKPKKTIIFSSCNSTAIEYVTDSVIVLINGRKVSQTNIENFNINQMLYKLMCSMEPDTSDYTLTRYIRQTFPMIRYEETVDRIVYFSVPQMDINDVWHLLNSLDHYGNKLGIWRYKFIAVGMRHLLSKSYDRYLKYKKRVNVNFDEFDVLPEKIKERSEVYKRYFFLMLSQKMIFYCRYPNRLLMRFLIPILVLIVWVNSTSLSHPTIFLMDNGFYLPSYKEEINSNHRIFLGCNGDAVVCSEVRLKLQPKLTFIDNIEFHYYNNVSFGFKNFQAFLFQKGELDYLSYNNFTLFAIFFHLTNGIPDKATVLTNDYKSRIFAYNLADYVMTYPKNIKISRLERMDLDVQTEFVEINYLLRLIMIILFAYSLSTYRYVAQNVHQQFYMIHNLAGIHFSIIHLPSYLMDIFLYFLIMCFMILFLYVMEDHRITTVRGNIFDLLVAYFLFVLADSSFKLLVHYISGYNPIVVFVLKCVDIFIIFYLNVVYMINYAVKIQKFSFGGIRLLDENFYSIDRFFKLFFPSANLNAAIKSIMETDKGSINGFLILQWLFYLSILFVWHFQSHNVRRYFNQVNFRSMKLKKQRVKKFGNENSFLYIKDISFIHKDRKYFENVNIEFKQGTVWGILGRNNSGKTHFLNIILGNRHPTRGGIYLYNQLVNTLNHQDILVKVGYCSEKQFFISDLTVEETLRYWSRLKLLPEQQLNSFMIDILTVLLLANEKDTRIRDLSLTNIKKLDIGIAIIGYPDIIILDDPLSNLDSLSRQGVINLVERAKTNNSAVIITASEISELRHILTNIAILENDKLIFHGKFVDAIYKSKIGYYVTIFFFYDILEKGLDEKLTDLIQASFKDSTLFETFHSHVIYFLPFHSLTEPNTTKILLFMETIRSNFQFERYLIKYDVYFSNS